MVGGPCRGKNCDFWARIKIEKKSVDEMTEEILARVKGQNEGNPKALKQAIQKYWECLGVKNRNILRKEKPEIYAKMMEVERQVLTQAGKREG